MQTKVMVQAWNVKTDRESKEFGPFEYVQMTYDLLRTSENDGDHELGAYNSDKDLWIFLDGFEYTDFSIYAEKN